MKYVVFSPENRLICFEEPGEVEEYCLEKDNDYLNIYSADQDYTYESMTPVEIGYAYVTSAAEKGGCRIYETKDVLNKMHEYDVPYDMIKATLGLFYDTTKSKEIDCPSYLEDIFMELTPIPVASMTDGIYMSSNVDGASNVQPNSGI